MNLPKIKGILGGVVMALAASASQAAPVTLGNYTLHGVVDTLTGFSGYGMYDGSAYVDPYSAPGPVTDDSGETFYATAPYVGYDDVTLGLDFTSTRAINGPGDDLLFLFTWEQSGNTLELTVNGITRSLNLQILYGCGSPSTQCVLDGMSWNSNTYDNNLLLVGLVDLDDFGIASGGVLSGGLELHLAQNTGTSIIFNLAGAMNVTPVPVPAAFWLMASGLGLLGAWRRRG